MEKKQHKTKLMICSAEEALRFVLAHFSDPKTGRAPQTIKPYVAISIQDSGRWNYGFQLTENRFCRGVLTLYFDDFEEPESGVRLMNEEQAEQIIAFLKAHQKCPEKKFNALYFFESRQCSIFMKDHTKIIWDIEMTLEAVILPDLDEIEYVHFYSVPLIMEQAAKFGIDDDRSRMWVDFGICDLGRHIGDGICSECEFDSIRGAFQDGEPYDRAVRQNPYHSGDYTALIRYWTEYSVQLNITRKAFHGTYFANTMDGAIGALVAEQILMSGQFQCQRA